MDDLDCCVSLCIPRVHCTRFQYQYPVYLLINGLDLLPNVDLWYSTGHTCTIDRKFQDRLTVTVRHTSHKSQSQTGTLTLCETHIILFTRAIFSILTCYKTNVRLLPMLVSIREDSDSEHFLANQLTAIHDDNIYSNPRLQPICACNVPCCGVRVEH